MPLIRRLLALASALLCLTALPAPAFAADYDAALEITFPTNPGASYTDTYDAARSGGRRHRASDLMTDAGQPVYAAKAGIIVWLTESEHASAGFGMQVRARDGRTYAYYHLGPAGGTRGQAIADGLQQGDKVSRGQFIGVVGDSGNAAGGSPHLHFEISDPDVTDPYGGTRVNPYASLRAAERRGDYAEEADTDVSRSRAERGEPVLRRGDRGEAVAEWQRQLNDVRKHDLAVDGVFGEGTHKATAAFQREHDLVDDGVVGAETRAAMERARDELAAEGPANQPQGEEPVLRRGDRGAAVEDWQRQLNRVRRKDITVDGVFGRDTHVATTRFQSRHDLTPDGIVGARTRDAMRRALQS
jgi:peptidoglycan hydrolase-like protein with peptidoglycan-binding domain